MDPLITRPLPPLPPLEFETLLQGGNGGPDGGAEIPYARKILSGSPRVKRFAVSRQRGCKTG